jgi:hypothetical protein
MVPSVDGNLLPHIGTLPASIAENKFRASETQGSDRRIFPTECTKLFRRLPEDRNPHRVIQIQAQEERR